MCHVDRTLLFIREIVFCILYFVGLWLPGAPGDRGTFHKLKISYYVVDRE
jgi:hypothetical protein